MTRPANFKSGYATREIVRSLLTGFNGTPMPGYAGTVSTSDAWKIAYYVKSLAESPESVAAQPPPGSKQIQPAVAKFQADYDLTGGRIRSCIR